MTPPLHVGIAPDYFLVRKKAKNENTNVKLRIILYFHKNQPVCVQQFGEGAMGSSKPFLSNQKWKENKYFF